MHACYLLDGLEIDMNKSFLSKMPPDFMNIGKENISISNILEVVAKLPKCQRVRLLHISPMVNSRLKPKVKFKVALLLYPCVIKL